MKKAEESMETWLKALVEIRQKSMISLCNMEGKYREWAKQWLTRLQKPKRLKRPKEIIGTLLINRLQKWTQCLESLVTASSMLLFRVFSSAVLFQLKDLK
jgi:hypothetical protein